MKLFTKQKQTHRLRKQIYGYRREVINWEFGINIYTLLYIKYITGTSLVVQCLRLSTSTAGDMSSMPSQGTKIP